MSQQSQQFFNKDIFNAPASIKSLSLTLVALMGLTLAACASNPTGSCPDGSARDEKGCIAKPPADIYRSRIPTQCKQVHIRDNQYICVPDPTSK